MSVCVSLYSAPGSRHAPRDDRLPPRGRLSLAGSSLPVACRPTVIVCLHGLRPPQTMGIGLHPPQTMGTGLVFRVQLP